MSKWQWESASVTVFSTPGMWKTWSCRWCDSSRSTAVVRRLLYSGCMHKVLNMAMVLALSEKITTQKFTGKGEWEVNQ